MSDGARVEPHHLESSALGRSTSFMAYVPDADPAARFPVLYLLHGATGCWRDWPEHADPQLRNLAQTHQLIVITPDGGEHGWYLNSDRVSGHGYETHLIEELPREVERRLPALAVRSVAGLSMGGHGAITLSWKHPGFFVSASSMSGVVDLTRSRLKVALTRLLGPLDTSSVAWHSHSAQHMVVADPERARAHPLRVSCGASDYYAEANRQFSATLSAEGVEHVFEESPGDHGWDYWTAQLPIHVAWHAALLDVHRGP